MPDTLGPISIPDPPSAGAWPSTLPCPEIGASELLEPAIIVHRMGGSSGKLEQRFYQGPRTVRYQFTLRLSIAQWTTLKDFWEATDGGIATFTYPWVNQDGTITSQTVRFDMDELSSSAESSIRVQCGIALAVVPATFPSYTSSSSVDRFPSAPLNAALAAQVQEIIPLLKATCTDGTTFYVSDRRVTIDGNLHLPRLIEWQGIQQVLNGASDQASFVLGNADQAFGALCNAVDLYRARLEFSLFHVGTTTKLNLWSGYCAKDPPFAFDNGPKFTIFAADGLHELRLTYPRRKITRTCWKRYKDGIHCTATSGLTTCGKTWEDCTARANTPQFGGIVAPQQLVSIKDNSTGVWGMGRSQITSANVSEESVYDQVLPQAWGNTKIPVPCAVVTGRDESDFYSALGIVSEGPIDGFDLNLNNHTLDGQGPHDPQRGGGFRGMRGTDPAGADDYFGISQAPWSGPSAFPGATRAAGVATVEIRRTDAKGIQIQRTADRVMKVFLTGGMGAWRWTAPGSRVWENRLANPVWMAVNFLLNSLGLYIQESQAAFISPATMEQYFDVEAAIAAAAICDQVVTPIFGSGTENQFVFNGVIRDLKPLRDWISEVLATCLGYWTLRNNKLRIGIRINASSVDSYSNGNMLMDSLQVQGVSPGFNSYQMFYGEASQGGVLDSIIFSDEDHALRIGAGGQPEYFRGQSTLAGVQGRSQVARLIITKLREETGGVGATEQRRARTIEFTTTILGLAAEPGQVITVTDPMIPTGSGKFRITSTTWNPDFSVVIAATTVTDSMYDYVNGPKPKDEPANPPVYESYDAPSYLIYCADQESPETGDPMFATYERAMGLRQEYEQKADGVIARLVAIGKSPIDTMTPAEKPPKIRTVVPSTTGGQLLADRAYSLSVAPVASDGSTGPMSNRVQVFIPAGPNTGSVPLTNITWPTGSWTGYRLFAADDTSAMCEQEQGSGTPSSITLTQLKRHTKQYPAVTNKFVRVKAKWVPHAGVIGTAVTALPSPNVIECSELVDDTAPFDSWTGRIVSWLCDTSDLSTPLRNYTVTAFDPATGRLTVDRNVVISGSPEDSMSTGDVIVIRMKPSASSPDTITDPGLIWRGAPDGLDPVAEIGRQVRIVAGKGRGQFRTISAATATSVTVDPPFDGGIDSTSVPIIEEASWAYRADSSSAPADIGTREIEIALNIDNAQSQAYLVMAFLVDDKGTESLEEYSFAREVFVLAQPGGVQVIEDWDLNPTANAAFSAKFNGKLLNRFKGGIEEFSTDGGATWDAAASSGAGTPATGTRSGWI